MYKTFTEQIIMLSWIVHKHSPLHFLLAFQLLLLSTATVIQADLLQHVRRKAHAVVVLDMSGNCSCSRHRQADKVALKDLKERRKPLFCEVLYCIV